MIMRVKTRSRLIFAAITGALVNLGMPILGLNFYIWFALVPLFILLKSNQKSNALLEAFVFGLCFYLISFHWLLGLHSLSWQGLTNIESLCVTFLAWVLPSIFHASIFVFFAWIFRQIYKKSLTIFQITILAFVWVVIQHKILLNLGPNLGLFLLPISMLAYSQYQNLYLVQIADSIGAIGLEFAIIFVNLFASNFFCSSNSNFVNLDLDYLNSRSQFLKSCSILIIFVWVFIYGHNKISQQAKFQTNQEYSVNIIQANLLASQTRSSKIKLDQLIDIQANLTKQSKSSSDLVIWAEGAVPNLERPSLDINQITKAFIYGTFSQDKTGEHNSLALDDFIHARQFYNKRQLVPFGEYTPLYRIFPKFLQDLANSTIGEGFKPGAKRQALLVYDNLEFASSICFEALFPIPIREQVAAGANVILNLSDLSWFANLPNQVLQKEFLAAAVLRAIENHRYLLLASNSGYSAIINPCGKLEALSPANQAGLLHGKFHPIHSRSIYTLWGW